MIRLARVGARKQPHYRIVVIEKDRARNGRSVEVVGTYNPRTNPATVDLKRDRIDYWVGNGAQMSDRVGKLFAKPVDRPGSFMAAPKKKDESVAAKLGSEPQEGVGSGIYSEFLHQWAVNVSAIYNPGSLQSGCLPVFSVGLERGHVVDAEPLRSCGAQSDEAFRVAVLNAAKPPIPTS